MNLGHIREFLTVASLRSFSRAARQLFVSQSALSRHVSALEEELGALLLIRSTHSVDLTPLGVTAYESFHTMMQSYDALVVQAREAADNLNALLRLGVFPIVVDEYAYVYTKALREQYPNVRVKCESGLPEALKTLLLDDELDIAMMVTTDFAGAERMRFRVSGHERYVAMLDERHPLARAGREALTLADLSDECVLIHRDEQYARCALAAMTACGFTPSRTALIPGIDTLQLTLMETNGVFISASSLQKMAFRGVRCLPFVEEGMALQVFFAYKTTNPNPAIPLFLKMLPMEA